MALFFRDDTDMSHRQTGFNRYRQLMSFYSMNWLKVNLITMLGALPLTIGIAFSIMASSLAVLVPVSFIGGMVFGPFFAGMMDSVMRGLRDAPNNWWFNYKKSWKNNLRSSLIPGGIFGLCIGIFAFMFYIMMSAQVNPSAGTIVAYIVSIALVLMLNTLYWPQLVLFEQSPWIRIKNAILFTIKHFSRVLGAVALELIYIAIFVLLAPWSLLLVPALGFWFIVFISQFRIYEFLDRDLKIEEQFVAIEGSTWDDEEPEEDEASDDFTRFL